jgi:hypothetical protein
VWQNLAIVFSSLYGLCKRQDGQAAAAMHPTQSKRQVQHDPTIPSIPSIALTTTTALHATANPTHRFQHTQHLLYADG